MPLPTKVVIEIREGRVHIVATDKEIDLVIIDWDDINQDADYCIEQITVSNPHVILDKPSEISSMFKRCNNPLEKRVGEELEQLGF